MLHQPEHHARGAYFQSPDGQHSISIFRIGFVVNTSSSVNDFLLLDIQHPEHYVNLAIKDSQLWNDVLRLSGGALEPTKCSYHFLYFDFTVTGNPILLPGKIDPNICIYFNNGSAPTARKQLPAYNHL